MEKLSEGDTEEDYGLIRPSLIKSLRSILDQYPDDGQILKELIQNAEDAGASKAQFMFDGHSYGTSNMYNEGMAQFQGPSLFAFNDALFDEKDWKGIRMLQDSIKENDPMKVGRFGLGFKSVLHLTDLPSVISGDRVYMIDPHEKYFMFQEQRTTGKRWLLKEHSRQITNLYDQFAPYRDKFDCTDRTFANGHYKGTMFRFPLRRKESALSDTLYDEQRITDLFNSFETDAHMVLLFLKNLLCVELLMRPSGQKEPEVKFRVSVSKKYKNSLAKRMEFSNRLKEASGNSTSVTYPLEIETTAFEHGLEKSKKTYIWLVNEYYGGNEVSNVLCKLQSDPSLGYIPVVGTAMPLQQTYSTNVKDDSEESPRKRTKHTPEDVGSEAIGQVFCFLPLPVEQKSATGLPVHVNGYFSVSQNRRHLKWPTTSQDYKADKSLLWNHCLLKELIPKSYCDLIVKAVELNESKKGIVMQLDVELALPNMLQVDEKWQVILEPIFKELFHQEIFYSPVNGGKWLEPNACVFDCLKEEPATKEVVQQVLLAAGVPVVSIPPHILMAMGAYFDEDMEEVSSHIVREALLRDELCYHDLPEEKKLLLLRYILKDGDFKKLDSIKLLPLASNEFVNFRRRAEPVFICTPDYPAELLPGLQHMLLKTNIDEDIMKNLTKLAEENQSQLRMLDAPIVVSLLQKIVPKKLEFQEMLILDEASVLTPSWLEELWNFLRKHYPGDLGLLIGLPVLPLNRELPITLVPIMLPSGVVCHSAMGAELPADMCRLLTEIGVHVIEELPDYVQNHAAVIGNYVRLPLAADVVDSMKVVCEKSETGSIHEFFSAKFTEERRNTLVSFLSRVSSGELSEDLIYFLRQIPMFECTNEKRQLVSAEMVDRAAPNYNIPVLLEQDYLKLPSEDYMRVAKLLRVKIMNNTSLLSETLLPKMKSRFYSNDQIQEIMEHILADIHVYLKDDPDLYTRLADIPFVVTESGNTDKPRALFDPEIEVLRDLFVYENRFPSKEYADKEWLQLLRKMGLQTALDVTSKDLLYCANFLDEACSHKDGTPLNAEMAVLEKKSIALVRFLSHKPEELNTDTNGQQLKQWLTDMCWVPVIQTKPAAYPPSMPWKGEHLEIPFAKPGEAVDMKYASLVASQKLVLSKPVSDAVEKAFAWDSKPDMDDTVCHLLEVVQCYQAQEKAGYLAMITDIYRHLQQIESSELLECLQDKQLEEWVWQGDGFTALTKIFPKRQFIDLSPYVFSVPTEMKDFIDLFTQCGMKDVCPGNALAAILEQIKGKYDECEGTEPEEVNRDLMLVVDILNHVKTLDRNANEVILMPAQTTTRDRIHLWPSSELTYCDTEWLRQGMDLLTFDEQDGILFIHDNVPVSTAEALHVPTLMSRMLHAEELEITGFGQTQPLTDRYGPHLKQVDDSDLAGELKGDLSSFTSDRKKLLCALETSLSTRFIDREHESVLSVCKILKFENWPDSGEDPEYGCDDIQAVVKHYKPILQQANVDVTQLESEWISLKVLLHSEKLRQLLEDYTDGLSIPKELIQNADDAHATVVKFLYDQRTNKDHQQFLIDVGMKSCQGPALWAYNNAVFSDADFKNIIKLGGATKEVQIDKIGKFGLGFNAVYNVTDVPSFVSRNNIVIFDPHTKHLGRSIRDRSKPGIKIDMQKNRTLLRKLTDQFKPYEDVFNCQIGADKEGSFDGTLFRLPLRTQQQASCSEICNLHYNHQEVIKLLEMTIKQSHNLLLFTQNVVKVEFYHLEDGKDPSEAELLFEVQKEPVKIIRPLITSPPKLPENADISAGQRELIQSSNYLSAISEFMKSSREKKSGRDFQVPQVPQSTIAIKVIPNLTEVGEKMLKTKQDKFKNTFWLISACMGQEKSLQFSQSRKPGEFLPIGGVAMALSEVGDGAGYVPKIAHRGLAFCFLPLPIPTEMLVHVNGSFAIQSSRKYLAEDTDDDKHSDKFRWNQLLIEDAVMHAYIQLLCDIKSLLPPDSTVNLYEAWPTHSAQYFKPLLYSFIKCIASLPKLEVMYKNGNPVEFSKTMFLDPDFSKNDRVKEAALKVFSTVVTDQEMINLPNNVLKRFREASCTEFVQQKTLTVVQFFQNIYFPNIEIFDVATRDILLIFALGRENKDLDPLLKVTKCIPVSPNGEQFRRPNELIYPSGMAAKLYTVADGRFPVGMVAEGNTVRLLEGLGMKINDVDWEHLIERAESVAPLYSIDPAMGRDRVQNIWIAIDVKISWSPRQHQGQPQLSQQQLKAIHDKRQEMAAVFKSIPFLPTQKPPKDYPVAWRDFDKDSPKSWKPVLLSSDDLFPYDMRYLVSSTQYIMDDWTLSHRVKKFLGFDKKQALVPQVVTQVQHAMDVDPASMTNKNQYELLESVFCSIYGFLQEACKEDETLVSFLLSAFQDQKCLLIDNILVEPKKVAFMKHVQCAPYLFSLPSDLERKFEPFMKNMGVRDRFEVEDYMGALHSMHAEYNDRKMSEESVQKSVMLSRLLNESMEKDKLDREEVEEKYGPIYVPNDNGLLQHASTLCFNDCTWLTNTKTMKFAHPKLALRESARLGVKTKKQEVLKKYTSGISFGQKHSLVDGIHQLLRNYPLDHEIFKEMIQNADDAGASQVHFILDYSHYKHDLIFDESWKPLQGPALLVYNNKPFSTNDLEAVQMFGQGSKVHDPMKTGQYGLGFSSVYHITDVPCILTSGPEVGKTLCVFDPLCSYVPGATPAEPGTRYLDIENLQKDFPHVLDCFHMDEFSVDEATLFRFPLRTSKTSKLSSDTISPERVKRLLMQLKEEIFDILLFTNSVVNIKLSVRKSSTEPLQVLYEANSAMHRKDADLRQEFVEATVRAKEVLRRPIFSLADIIPANVVFLKSLRDTEDVLETWCISQNVGIPEDTEVPDVVEEAFKKGNMVLLPRGGVAYVLNTKKGNSLFASPRARKLCCVLPLPVKTELNVHVNGHFALGSQNRRQLATAEENECSSCWNVLLFEKVIAPAFIKLLEKHRVIAFKQQGDIDDDTSFITMPKFMLQCCLNVFQKAFPNFLPKEPQLSVLVKAVYTTIASQNSPVMPCVKEVINEVSGDDTPTEGTDQKSWRISWLPPAGTGSKKAFFISKEQEQRLGKPDATSASKSSTGTSLFTSRIKSAMYWLKGAPKPETEEEPAKRTLKDVLLSCGFKVLDVGQTITENFIESGVEIDFMSPEGVVKFFKSYSSSDPACEINTLPCPIEETPIKDADTLVAMAAYCKEAATEEFVNQLEGLPFLLTNDGVLRVFSRNPTVFLSEFGDLLKLSGDKFVHKLLQENIFKDVGFAEGSPFEELTIEDLEEMLHLELLPEFYYDTQAMVAWNQGSDENSPTRDWVMLLWRFLAEYTGKVLQTVKPKQDRSTTEDPAEKMASDVETDELTKSLLSPLDKWAIIPVSYKGRRFLTSLQHAYRVIHFYATATENKILYIALKELQLPQLSLLDLDGINELKLAELLVTTPAKPHSVLRLLCDLVADGQLEVKSSKITQKILLYFCENLEVLVQDEVNKERLKALPFYKTVYKDTIALTDCQVYTIPAEIPTDGIDVWRSKSGMVFLKRIEELKPLYDFIECANISAEEVYCQFIFQHLEYFSQDQRMVHLHHVYKTYVKDEDPRGTADPEERERVIATLRDIPIIEDEDGDMQPASEFYDPENSLFQIIVPRAKFPPRVENSCFKDSEWYRFLRNLGLVTEVTEDMFLEYTTAVSLEGRDPTSASAELKSRALCDHMFEMKGKQSNAIMKKISDVPFVAPEKVPFDLSTVCLQHGDCGNGLIPYMSFKEGVSAAFQSVCWTSANILPSWADPDMRMDTRGKEGAICKILGISERPRIEVVISHIRNICELECVEDRHVAKTRLHVFQTIYKFLQESISLDENDKTILVKELSKLPCIIVEGGRVLVRPEQTVFNIYDEIRHYLYKVPLELGDVQTLFKTIGSTERATGKQYGSVLAKLHQENKSNSLNPNDMRIALKATKGYFEAIEESSQNRGNMTLYLPNQNRVLKSSCQLVFNNSPYHYERVKGLRINFMVDLSHCGIRKKNVDELVDMMPLEQRPKVLSELMKEHLDSDMKSCAVQDGTAAKLEARIKSYEFQCAVQRLIKHGMYKAGSKFLEEEMLHTIDRLSNIKIFNVPEVKTQLFYEKREIERRDLVKKCFATTADNGLGEKIWYVYIAKDAVLDQELLIPLVEVINSILSGMLRDSVLYLLPLLSCEEKDMHKRLDSLNIKVDVDTQAMRQVALLPQLGAEVSEEDARKLEGGCTEFEEGEYVGFQGTTESSVVYGQIQEQFKDQGRNVFVLQVGVDPRSRQEAVQDQLYRFVRK